MVERTSMGGRSLLQTAALLSGVVFLLVGVAGFIPGITTDYDELGEFGEPAAELIGLFGINWLENIVHLLFAVVAFAAARTWAASRLFFLGGGAVYLVVWLYGILIDLNSDANFIGVNSAANWLHFIIGVGMIAVGIVLGGRAGARAVRV